MTNQANSDQTNSEQLSIPIWFWIIGVVLLLWNLMGLAVFGIFVSMMGDQEALATAGMNEEQQKLIMETPNWVNVAFGVAVVAGVLGCILLLMRRKIAVPVLVISLLGVLAQNTFVYFLSNSIELMGVGLSPLVIITAIAIVPFALYCVRQGWMR